MNLPLSTAFTVSHRGWVVVFSFSFISMHILISFLISFCDLLVIQQRVVQPPYVGIFNSFSPIIDIQSYCIVVRKDLKWLKWFNFFEFTKVRFMTQDVIYPGEDSMCTLRKRWNSLFGGEMSYRYQLGLTGLLYHLKFVFPC